MNNELSLPKNTLAELTQLYVPTDVPPASLLRMSVSLPERDVNIRELAAYLGLMDSLYGRLSEHGTYSYSHKRQDQLKYAEVREGSWQLVFTEPVSASTTHRFLLLYLLLKHLPYVRHGAAEETRYRRLDGHRYAANGHSYENRNQLRRWMPQDPLLRQLESKRLAQLVEVLDRVYAMEAHHLSAPIRFAIASVKDISFAVERRWSLGDPNAYPLRGTVTEYHEPFEPVALDDWDILN